MPTMWSGRDWKLIEQRRREYAKKLRALGILEGSNKWRKLMCRKIH
jgi:hypothetical protein